MKITKNGDLKISREEFRNKFSELVAEEVKNTSITEIVFIGAVIGSRIEKKLWGEEDDRQDSDTKSC